MMSFTALSGVGNSLTARESGLTRIRSAGGVTVKVTYLNPQSGEETRFDVSLDTHSVNLDAYDLKALSVLREGAGKEHKPSRVDNKGSGHHRQVILVFDRPASKSKQLKLVIKEIAGVKERSFSWDESQ